MSTASSCPYNQIKFVFDLDMTLYGKSDYKHSTNEKAYYDSFKPKYFLHSILSMSPYKKYILTNAIKDHAIEVTKRIGICQAIPHSNIYSIDMAPANIMKPDPTMYHRACNHFGIQKNDIVFYFEDLKENLQPVKILYNNWKTVWICPNKETLTRIPPYVDMVFTTIEAALLHIYSILRVNKKSDARPITVPAITNGITRLPTKDSQQQRDGPVEKRSKLTNQKGN